MTSLSEKVAHIFKRIMVHENRKSLINEINHSLFTISNEASDEERYNELLVQQIARHSEQNKVLHHLLTSYIAKSTYPVLEEITPRLQEAERKIEKNLGELERVYVDRLLKNQQNDDHTTILEKAFVSSLAELHLTYRFLNYFGVPANRNLFEPLLMESPADVGATILAYAQIHSELALVPVET